MIKKSRLEELIEQGATIWHYEWKEIKLDKDTCKICEVKRFFSQKHIGWVLQFEYDYNGIIYTGEVDINELEEDVEKGKWDLEFSNITRTETLELPTWEEFHGRTYYNKHYGIIFQWKASGCTYQMYEELTPENIIIYDADCQDIVFSKPPTKENYTLACRKCEELFLGKGE